MIEIATERLRIRPITRQDEAGFRQILGDEAVMAYSDDGPLDAAAVAGWVAEQMRNHAHCPRFGRWAVARAADRGAIGYVGLTRQHERTEEGVTELGFRLARQHWGKGYATEAARAIVTHAFEGTETHRVIAIVDPRNAPSLRVLEKLGMAFCEWVLFEGYDHPDKVFALDKPSL